MSPQIKRITPAAQEAFHKSITTPAPDPYDEIDLAVCDAELDLKARSHREADRVLRILDQLQTGRGR